MSHYRQRLILDVSPTMVYSALGSLQQSVRTGRGTPYEPATTEVA